MDAFDFKKIADEYNDDTSKKRILKTKRRTAQFFKLILKLVKKQAKKGYYFLEIPNYFDFVDYKIVFKKLEDLNFHIIQNYGYYTVVWRKVEDKNDRKE